MSDRIAVMRAGVLEQMDEPRVIYDDPSSEFIASFVGQSNKFPAKVSIVSDFTELRTASGTSVRVRRRPEHVVGAECIVCVRPEAISLRHAEDSQAGDNEGLNSLSGQVTNITFVGDHIRTTVSTLEHSTLIAKSARSSRDSGSFDVGTKVDVTWSSTNSSAYLHDVAVAPGGPKT